MKPKRFGLGTTTLSMVLGALIVLSTVQRSPAPGPICLGVCISIGVVGVGTWVIYSCDPPWRCWCVPNDPDNSSLGCATNFPSQVSFSVGRANGWWAARNLTYKTRELCLRAICSITNNPFSSPLLGEEYLTVLDAPTPLGPWKYLDTLYQSPEDIYSIYTNTAPQRFYRVFSTNAAASDRAFRSNAMK